MGALIFFGFLILAVLIILPVFMSVSTNNKVKDMADEITHMRKSFDALYNNLNKPAPFVKEGDLASEIQNTEEILKTNVFAYESLKNISIIKEETLVESNTPEENIIKNDFVIETENAGTEIADGKFTEPYRLESGEGESQESEKIKPKSDIERFIGEKLLSLVGIGVFVLGIFFLVKWAIDQKLINDAGKVSIGILSGILLIGTAHRLRNSVRAFSSILVGGGIAVLYFTVYIAFQDYHLLNQTPAFFVMIIITAFAVMLSIFYDKMELAVIAIIGGFLTPFFVSTGEGNYKILFSYLLILNIGMFILANFKRWNPVNIISYAFTVLIFGGWMLTKFDVLKGHTAGGLIFATLFYIIFFGMNLIYNIRNMEKFKPVEISMLLSNTLLYYAVGMYILAFIQKGEFQGLFTIGVATANFTVAFFLYKNDRVDKNLVYLLIGLVLTFASLSGPVQLDGNYITLFWAMEMVLLLWLGQKSGIKIIKEAALPVAVLALISLIMDWVNVYGHSKALPIFINKAFITGIVVLLAFTVKIFLLKKDIHNFRTIALHQYQPVIKIISLVLIYLTPLLELIYQLDSRYTSGSLLNSPEGDYLYDTWFYPVNILGNFIVMYNYAFVILALYFAVKFNNQKITMVFAILSCILIALFIFFNTYSIHLRHYALEFDIYKGIFYSHFINPVLALFLLFMFGKYLLSQVDLRNKFNEYFAWYAAVAIVIILSSEIIHIWVVAHYRPGFSVDDLVTKGIKICWPILWGVTSFVIMAIGMRRKLKTLRIISLSLFTLTLIKLFTYDISNATQGGKIAAFISLGILLLSVSFMYQKLKDILIDTPVTADEPD